MGTNSFKINDYDNKFVIIIIIIIIKVFISSQDKKYISYVTFEYLSKKVPT